ncbi:hypothetical protein CXB51_002684 [Gossypium anomalum]|uniref:Uncharacterized protein n=1 Tax=Gossypium anomalum TaxID=47600 RepID=A0A8J5Z5F1_9ROSI|nr:hypothetical protein CXB51_002684 [Gossypium anomalum]
MAQIGRTGHGNYPFKGKMRVDPVKTCTDMLLKSPHSPSPLHRKVYAQAFNHPKLTGNQRSKALSTAQTRCAIHGRVRLLHGGGVKHGAELWCAESGKMEEKLLKVAKNECEEI